MWAIIGPWECKCIPGSKWPIPIELQMVRVHFSFFVNNCFTRNTRKFYFKNLSPFPEIMLRGSLILISQIMVMNNKEYTLRELLPNFDLNQNIDFTFFEKSVISKKNTFQQQNLPIQYLKTLYPTSLSNMSRFPNWVMGKAF